MDKLSTYALVAALKEISRKQNPSPNERWVSLRSCMTDLEQTSIETSPKVEPAPSMLTTTPSRGGYSYIREVDLRHQDARRRHDKRMN